MSKQRPGGKRRKRSDAGAASGLVASDLGMSPREFPSPPSRGLGGGAPDAGASSRECGQGQGRRVGVFAVILVVAVCAVWANALRAPFVLDDGESIVGNASIRDFWALRWLNPPAEMGETVSGRPVLNFSFAVNYALGGLGVRGYHLGNLFLHAAAALVLFGVARRVWSRCGSEWGGGSVARGARNGAGEPVRGAGIPARRLFGGARRAALVFWEKIGGVSREGFSRAGGASEGGAQGGGRHSVVWIGEGAGGGRRLEAASSCAAFAVALLWALHPLQTAAVTYVVQRAEVLAGLFYLLTVYGFIRAAEEGDWLKRAGGSGLGRESRGSGAGASSPPEARRRASSSGIFGGGRPPFRSAAGRRWGALAVAACALGMGTKETVVTAPVVVLLMDRAFFAGSFREAWRRRRRLYGGLAATWLLLGALVLSNAGRGGSAGLGSEIGAWDYLLTQCGAIARYLGQACWPASLVFDHGTPVAAGPGAVWWQGLLLCALGAGTLRALRRNHAAGFLGAWFFLMLAPSSSFVPVSTQTVAEHRMYLALAAVVALACAGAWRMLARVCGMGARGGGDGARPRAFRLFSPSAFRPLFWVSLGCAAAALGAATVARNAVYRTAVSLWSDTVEKRPDNPRARNNLGAALSAEGRTVEAAAQFRQAIALRPNHAFAHFNLGVALVLDPRAALDAGARNAAALDAGAAGLGSGAAQADGGALRAEALRQAEHHFRAALAAEPGNTDARVNLGKLLADSGRTAEAMEHYRAALAGDPAAQDARVNLAALLAADGREAEGAALLREALAAAPGLAEAHYQMGLVLEKSGARREAETEFRAAVRLKPGMAAAHLALGNCLARRGDAGAEACYREALRLEPKLAEAWYALGNGLAKQERFPDAMEAYREALRLDPAHVQALNNLGNCQLVTGRVREAVETYEEVLRRRPGDATVRQNLDYARELLGTR